MDPSVLLLVHWLYDHDCCEDQHCHPVPCEEITSSLDGWVWHPLGDAKVIFYRGQQKPSPDGNCHVCVSQGAHTGIKNGICIYLPPRVELPAHVPNLG